MTPEEYANELIVKLSPYSKDWDYNLDEPLEENHAKLSALICIDEIIPTIQGEKIEWYLEVKRILENATN